MPQAVRGGGASGCDRSVSRAARPLALPRLLPVGPVDSGVSSTMVFHSPQASQRPDHLEVLLPQA